MFAVRDAFPALLLDRGAAAAVTGELYDVSLDGIRTEFLPDEPPELELTVIELDDGRSVLAVGLRPGVVQARPASSPTSPITAAGDVPRMPDPDS